MAKTNQFDELLASMEEPHRKALAEIAEAVPELKSGYLRQSDYSRNMDELKSEREKLQEVVKFNEMYQKWWGENWEPNALGEGQGATKRELEFRKRAEEYQKQLEEAQSKISLGEDVTFDQLNAEFNKLMSQHGLARQADVEKAISDKAAGVEQVVNKTLYGYGHVATVAPRLVYRHGKQFDEELKVEELVDFAAKNNYQDLEKAYGDFVAPRIEEKRKKEFEAQLEAAREEGRKKALEEKGMGSGKMPVDDTPPQMSAFAQKLMGMKPDNGGVEIPEDAKLGDQTIANIVARSQ